MTLEEIKALDADGIKERRAAISEEMTAENADLDALTKEVDALEARANELKEAAEKRAALAAKVVDSNNVVKENIVEEKTVEEKRTFAPDTVEYRDAYLKKLMGKDLTVEERGALVSAADVIPTEIVNQIYGRFEDNPLYAEMNIMRFPGYVQVPYAKTVNDASWKAMGTASTDSEDEVDSVSLSMYKLIKTVEITADIQAASIPAFQSWLVDALSRKMIAAICAATLNGTGSGQPTGIIGALTPVAATVTYDNILAAMAAVPGAYHRDAIFVMSSKSFFNKVMTLKDDQKRPLVVQGVAGVDRAPIYTLLGHRVILEDSADGASYDNILFGNFREGYAFNFAKDISIEYDGSVEFRKGSVVYRAMALCDGKPVVPEAFTAISVASASA
jgi:HK97 family phage major capsid protein